VKLREKLVDTGEGFKGFGRVLEESAVLRTAGEDEQRIWLKSTLQRLEFTLYTEIRRRVEASKTLQQTTEELGNELFSSLQGKVDYHLEKIAFDLDNLARRLSDLEEVSQGSCQDNTRIKRLHRHLGVLESCVTSLNCALEDEKSKAIRSMETYLSRMARISVTIDENFDKLTEREHERHQFLMRQLQNLSIVDGETTEEEFHSYCLEAIQCLRKKAERAETKRKKQDEIIVEAIERYAYTLQHGLGAPEAQTS